MIDSRFFAWMKSFFRVAYVVQQHCRRFTNHVVRKVHRVITPLHIVRGLVLVDVADEQQVASGIECRRQMRAVGIGETILDARLLIHDSPHVDDVQLLKT